MPMNVRPIKKQQKIHKIKILQLCLGQVDLIFKHCLLMTQTDACLCSGSVTGRTPD